MSRLWKRTRDCWGNTSLHEVDPSKLSITSPTVVFISGHMTLNEKTAIISDGFDFMEGLLHNKQDIPTPPQIYSWSHRSTLKTLFNVIAYGYLPQQAYSADAKNLAQGTVMPLVSQNGRPLPFAEAQKNLRNLTFLGYSAGSVVGQEVFNASMKMMKEIGYQPEEARKLLHEVAFITIGTVSRMTKEQNRFTTLNIANSDDRFVRFKNIILHPLRSVFSKADRQLTIKPLSDTSLFVTAGASQRIRDRYKKPREQDIQLRPWHYSTSNHDVDSYVSNDDKSNPLSKIVEYALINAVNRKTTLDPSKLLAPPATLGSKEKALYQSRITKAVISKK